MATASPGEALTRRIMGIETEYGLTCFSGGKRALGPEELARYLFRPVVSRYSSSNVFLPNGSRAYLDVGAHPEYATAECDDLDQVVAQHVAGDRIFDELARRAESALAADGIEAAVYLFKNNVDSVGNSYGCHENYLVARDAVLKTLGKRVMAFLITRQLICGAGMIAKPKPDHPAQFILSQRADQVFESVSSATTRSRPVINTRDEPHADSHRFRRMHIIVGDANMAEPTTALKLGSMLLVLEMIEAGIPVPEIELERPVAQGRVVARDLTGTARLDCVGGDTTSALEVQDGFYRAARSWLERRPEPDARGTSNQTMARVVELWGRTLRAVAEGDFNLIDTEIDWAIKYKLLTSYQARLHADLTHPKLAQLDLAYHDVRSSRGVFGALTRHGRVTRWLDEDDVAHATHTPPATTRARARGEFLGRARELGVPVTADWQHVKVARPEPVSAEFSDPFVQDPAELADMLAVLDRAAAAQEG